MSICPTERHTASNQLSIARLCTGDVLDTLKKMPMSSSKIKQDSLATHAADEEPLELFRLTCDRKRLDLVPDALHMYTASVTCISCLHVLAEATFSCTDISTYDRSCCEVKFTAQCDKIKKCM